MLVQDLAICRECDLLQENALVQQWEQEAKAPLGDNVPFGYGTLAQISQRAAEHRNQRWALQKATSRALAQTARFQGTLSHQSRLLNLLARHDIPRARCLLARLLQDGRSWRSIAEEVAHVVETGARLRCWSEGELDKAMLLLRLGGRACLHAAVQMGLCPSYRTLSRKRSFTSILPMLDDLDLTIFLHNAAGALGATESARAAVSESRKKKEYWRTAKDRALWSISIDELKVREKPSFHPRLNAIVGMVSRQGEFISRNFDSYKELLVLEEAMKSGRLQLASEALAFGANANRRTNYRTSTVAILPFKKEAYSAIRQRDQIKAVIDEWSTKQELEGHLGPLNSIGTDGEGQRRQVRA